MLTVYFLVWLGYKLGTFGPDPSQSTTIFTNPTHATMENNRLRTNTLETTIDVSISKFEDSVLKFDDDKSVKWAEDNGVTDSKSSSYESLFHNPTNDVVSSVTVHVF